jgi:hypothetical protein
MNFVQLFIQRRIATSLLALGLGLAGLGAYFLLPVSPMPNIERARAPRPFPPAWQPPWNGIWDPLPGSPK